MLLLCSLELLSAHYTSTALKTRVGLNVFHVNDYRLSSRVIPPIFYGFLHFIIIFNFHNITPILIVLTIEHFIYSTFLTLHASIFLCTLYSYTPPFVYELRRTTTYYIMESCYVLLQDLDDGAGIATLLINESFVLCQLLIFSVSKLKVLYWC